MMRYVSLHALLLISQACLAQEKFQLAPPMLKYPSGFFAGTTSFEVTFNQPGAEVRYTLDGKEPTENDLLYSGSVAINKRTTVKARAFGKDYLPSETVSATFIKDVKPMRAARYSKPNESYAGSSPDLLNDNIGGITNYRSGSWVGFDSDTVTVDIELNKKEKIENILINLLQDENSWIFLPERVQAYYFDASKKKYIPAAEKTFSHQEPGPKQCKVLEIKPAGKINTDKLKVVFHTVKKIPEWHSGKGQHGWLFIDEIKVY